MVETKVEVDIDALGDVGNFIKVFVTMSCSIRRKGSSSRVAEDKGIYSLSVVDKAISDWSLLVQEIGNPQKVTTKPVLDKTLFLRWLHSLCQRPAKSASTYMSKLNEQFGRSIMPLSLVARRYRPNLFTANSCSARGALQNRAHWCTVILISDLVWLARYLSLPITLL